MEESKQIYDKMHWLVRLGLREQSMIEHGKSDLIFYKNHWENHWNGISVYRRTDHGLLYIRVIYFI